MKPTTSTKVFKNLIITREFYWTGLAGFTMLLNVQKSFYVKFTYIEKKVAFLEDTLYSQEYIQLTCQIQYTGIYLFLNSTEITIKTIVSLETRNAGSK